MKLLNHHNWLYSGVIPQNAGDRYYSQDLIRDFWHLKDNTGKVIKDTIGVPVVVSGGVVTRLNNTTIEVTKCVAYVEFDVDVIDQFTGFPPTKKTQTVIARAESGFDVNDDSVASEVIVLSTLPGYVAGAGTYYLQLNYTEKDGYSRARAFATGSYAYERIPSYFWSLSTVLPGTDTAIVAELVFNGAGEVLTDADIDQETTNTTEVQRVDSNVPPIGSIIAVHKNVLDNPDYAPDPKVWAYCGVTPPVTGWVTAGGRVAGDLLPTNRFTGGSVPTLDDDRFLMGGAGTFGGATNDFGNNDGHYHGAGTGSVSFSGTTGFGGAHGHRLRGYGASTGTGHVYLSNNGTVFEVADLSPVGVVQETTRTIEPFLPAISVGDHNHTVGGSGALTGSVGLLSGFSGDALGSNRPKYFLAHFYMRVQ